MNAMLTLTIQIESFLLYCESQQVAIGIIPVTVVIVPLTVSILNSLSTELRSIFQILEYTEMLEAESSNDIKNC